MAKRNEQEIRQDQNIQEVVFEEVLHSSMLPYSEYVILDRSIPRVEDGLKPVQRRVLYSMHEMGLTPDKPHKKSARIVGDCLGKYHPHGDSSVYGALVRLAQTFIMRCPLVDGHGNFGSIDGDNAAAMRYTEARMSDLALEMLRDLDKETVPWDANFDESLAEPVILPGRFPNLYVNGSKGIAVGLSTNIPTHNMGECIDAAIAQIEDPNISTADLLKVFHGPDFPTGGFVIPIDSLESIYETGKGSVNIRSRIHIENEDNGKKSIVVTEIPYQEKKSDILASIARLKETDKDILAGIVEIVDESDKTGMRAVIRCKRDTDVKKVADYLFKKTNLEVSFPINIMAIADGKPEQMGLKKYLTHYVEYQRTIIEKRTAYDLKAAKARAEIVEGLLVAIANIDEVIAIIKQSESTPKAKETLRSRFGLSDAQAQAILDMRLKNLARLEVTKLEEELDQLKKTIADFERILASKRRQLEIVKKELAEIKQKYGSPRLTAVLDKDTLESMSSLPDAKEAVAYRDGILTLHKDGIMRFMSQKSFAAAGKDVSALGEDVPLVSLSVNNKGTLYAVTNFGDVVKIDVTSIPEKKMREKGFKLGALSPDAQTDERPVKLLFFDGTPAGELMLFTKDGVVKRVDMSEFAGSKGYFKAMSLAEGDVVIGADVVTEDLYALEVTKAGQVLLYAPSEVPVQGRNAAGVKGVKLNDGDSVVYGGLTEDEGEIVVITEKGHAKRVICAIIEPGSRYVKGVKLIELDSGDSVAFIDTVKMPYDIAYFANSVLRVVNTEDINIEARPTKGKFLAKGVDRVTLVASVKGI